MLNYSRSDTTLKVRLDNYCGRLKDRQEKTDTVASKRLEHMSKRLKAIPMYAGEYLLVVDGEVVNKLTAAQERCAKFKDQKTRIRIAQKRTMDEEQKAASLQDKLTKATNNGDANTEQLNSELQLSKKAVVEYKKLEETAVEDCVATLKEVKEFTEISINLAIKRMRTSIGRLARKTVKACREGIIEGIDKISVKDSATDAFDEGEVDAAAAADEDGSAALVRTDTGKLNTAREWLTSRLNGHNMKVTSATASLKAKGLMAGTEISAKHDEILSKFNTGLTNDVNAVQKTLYRVKGFAESLTSGPVPSKVAVQAMQDAAATLAEKHFALSAATVKEIAALMPLADARDEARAKLSTDAVPALEQLLQRCESAVLSFFSLREHLLDIATNESKLKTAENMEGEKKDAKVNEIKDKLKAKRVGTKTLIENLCNALKAEGNEPAPEDAADVATPESIAEIFNFSDTTGTVATLAAIIDEKVLVGYSDAFSAAVAVSEAAPEAGSKAAASKEASEKLMGAVADMVSIKRKAAMLARKARASVQEKNAAKESAAEEAKAAKALEQAEREAEKAAAAAAEEAERENEKAAAEEEKTLAEAAAEVERKEAEVTAAEAKIKAENAAGEEAGEANANQV